TAAARSPSWAADWRKVTRLSMEASWLRVWTLSPYGKLSLSRVECKSESVSHKALPYHSHTFLALGAKVKSTSISARSVRPSSRGGDEPSRARNLHRPARAGKPENGLGRDIRGEKRPYCEHCADAE